MPSRSVEDLYPVVAEKARIFRVKAAEIGHPVLITCTYRSHSEQEADYAKGRTTPGPLCLHAGESRPIGTCTEHPLGKPVTNARGGQSSHQYGLAFDCGPVDDAGRPLWNTTVATWRKLWKIAEEVGLDALGDPWGEYVSWDPGHCGEPGWKHLKEIAAAWVKERGLPA